MFKLNHVGWFSGVLFFFACVDVLQVQGVRVLVLLSFLFIVALIIAGKINNLPKDFYFLLVFMVFSLISIVNSHNAVKSFIYLSWPIVNFISLFLPFYLLGKKDLANTMKGILFSCRLTCLLGIFLWMFGVHARLQGFFYEPSYFSIALTPYFVYVILRLEFKITKENVFDGGSIVACLLGSMSGSLVLVILLAIFFRLLKYIKSPLMLTRSVLLSALVFILFFGYASNSNDLLSKTLSLVFSGVDNHQQLIDRAGNRFPRLLLALDVVQDNPTGVGVGTYIDYLEEHNFPKYSNLPEWVSPLSKPATNIYLEIAATCGWGAGVVFMIWNFVVIGRAKINTDINYVIFASFIIMIIALQIESNYLRPYFWCVFGLLASQPKANKYKERLL
ncbi:O-antigen ligase family protein [Aeromonas veronii]|uniref:O-antigen ligase family protein n=1 Tax=Aeromonas veronii TaxID=654 RepID=UPI003F7BCA54